MKTTLNIFKEDFYQRIGGLNFFKGRKVLDVGCGDGEDAKEISSFASSVTGVDIEENSSWKKYKSKKIKYLIANAEKLPFKDKEFDGLFLKDVLHHVDYIEKALKEIKRVTSDDAKIILVEGNRYNPIFYIHMTKMAGHEHVAQKKFKSLIRKYFPTARFIYFESHFIPFLKQDQFKVLIQIEKFISKIFIFKPFLSYNVAIIER